MKSFFPAKRALTVLTLLLLLFVPLIFTTRLYSAFFVVKLATLRALLILMTPLALYLYFIKAHKRSWISLLSFFILCFLFSDFIATLTSINPLVSVPHFIILLSYVIVYIIWTMNIEREDIRNYFKVILIAGLIASIYALLQHFGIDFPGIQWNRPELVRVRSIGTFGNPTFLAGFLVMILPLAFYLYLVEGREAADGKFFLKPGLSALYLIVWVICLLALILTFTRGAWIALVLSHIFLLALGWRSMWRSFRRKIYTIVLILLLALGVSFAFQYISRNDLTVVKRVLSFGNINEIYLDRIFLWKIGWLNFRDNPVLGTGPETFPYIFPRYRYLEPVENRGRIALPEACHNQFLDIASSMGVCGLLSYLAIIVALFYSGLKLVSGSEKEERLKWISILSCCTAYIIHNFFLYPTTATGMLWWFFLSLVSMEVVKKNKEEGKDALSAGKKLVLFMTSLFCVVLFVINMAQVWGNYRVKCAKEYEHSRRWTQAYAAYNEALICQPFSYKYHLFKGKMLEGFFREHPLRALPDKVSEAYLKSLALNPLDPYCWADIGRFYGYLAENFDRSYLDKGVENYQKAIELDAYNPFFYNDLANLYAHCGRDESALEYYRKAHDVYPRSVMVNLNLAIFYEQKKMTDMAMEHLKIVLELEPEHKKARALLKRIEAKGADAVK